MPVMAPRGTVLGDDNAHGLQRVVVVLVADDHPDRPGLRGLPQDRLDKPSLFQGLHQDPGARDGIELGLGQQVPQTFREVVRRQRLGPPPPMREGTSLRSWLSTDANSTCLLWISWRDEPPK